MNARDHRQPCPVCLGSQVIRLPLYRSTPVAFDLSFEPAQKTEESSRQYPCPECAPVTADSRIAFAECHAEAVDYGTKEADEHMQRQCAHRLVDLFLKGGFIAFKRGATDEFTRTYPLRGTLGVVAPSVVASMEERIAKRQTEKAGELAAMAAERIRVWGSHHSGDDGNISKGQAVDAIYEALKKL